VCSVQDSYTPSFHYGEEHFTPILLVLQQPTPTHTGMKKSDCRPRGRPRYSTGMTSSSRMVRGMDLLPFSFRDTKSVIRVTISRDLLLRAVNMTRLTADASRGF